jgi:hypothetical protein
VILAELIQAGGETLMCVIHKLINSIWNKEEWLDQWKESIIAAGLYSSKEGSIVQYSHRVWSTHEIAQADQNVFR